LKNESFFVVEISCVERI